MVRVDLETGHHIVTEFPAEMRQPAVLAVKDGSVFFMHDGAVWFSSLLMEFDPRTDTWDTTEFASTVEYPTEMEVTPDGKFLIAGEWGIFEMDPDAVSMRRAFETILPEFRGLAVDSTGAITTSVAHTEFVRERPGAAEPDRLLPGPDYPPFFTYRGFALESDDTLIAPRWAEPWLYRISWTEQGSEPIYEYEGDLIRRPVIDPEGRIVAIRNPEGGNRDIPAEIVRIDMDAGTQEVVTLPVGYLISDMDLLIVPEPSASVLLLMGILGVPYIVRRRQQRPAAECRRRGSGIAA
jgi:hypothetical protein